MTLRVKSIPLADQSVGDGNVLLRMTAEIPADGYTIELAKDNLVVVVNLDNPITAIEIDQLRDIYAGTDKDTLHPWIYPQGDDIQQLADKTVLSKVIVDPRVQIAPNPAALLEALEKDPAAIGYVPKRWLSDGVKPIELTGFSSDDLTVPILAVNKIAPTGALREWLLCVQDEIK